ncbi:hypothetical protein [Jiangella alkaliphila]|uniref:DUF4367 domain-containing protein n=1 Tax=Jiangella alkaliphila TaxID=419479 RepID=A0A1H2KFP2_9ACTN|nr:hypothetical protein [Jiangella alkaliphila]SDU67464.1 hypothetical protein SAMN04488563_3776 [Jiangella alkaliphila]
MTEHDDELARALNDVPVGEYAPIERLRGRARQLRLRRRLAGAGLAVGAAALVAVPSALAISGDGGTAGPQPAASGTSTPCPETYADIRDGEVPDPVMEPAGVPEVLRLLWSPDAAPAPERAFAEDASAQNAAAVQQLAGCPDPADQSVLVVQVDGDIVTRSALVLRVSDDTVMVTSEAATTLAAGDTEVTVERSEGFVSAYWESGGATWAVRGDELSDDEIAELIQTMRTDGGRLDVGDWSVAADAEQLIQGTGRIDRPGDYSYSAVGPDDLRLTVADEDDSLWLHARAGSRVTAVAGAMALVLPPAGDAGAFLAWQPTDGVTATLQGQASEAELLAIAETVGPVPVDEPRLADVWALGDAGL